MPKAWGGPELSPVDQIEVIEALSRAAASVGWCASILSNASARRYIEEIASSSSPASVMRMKQQVYRSLIQALGSP